jgi:uncharacterized protein YbbK (DUF523 family)
MRSNYGWTTYSRDPCDVVVTLEGLRVVGLNDSTIDHTAEYNKGAEEVLRLVKIFDVKKAYLLKDCPMCGKGYRIVSRLLKKHSIQISDV